MFILIVDAENVQLYLYLIYSFRKQKLQIVNTDLSTISYTHEAIISQLKLIGGFLFFAPLPRH